MVPALKDAQVFSERAPHIPSSAGAVLRIVAISVAVGFLFFRFVMDDLEAAFTRGGGLGGLVGCIAALIYGWYRAIPRRTISILVGADGVRVGRAVTRYADLQEVRLEEAQSSDSYVKTLVLVRRWRPPVRVASLSFPLLAETAADDVRQTALVAAISEGLSAWLARRDNTDRAAEQLLARGETTPSEWLNRLRALGSGATATYRDATMSRDTWTRLLASPAVKPSTRAAAAIALRAAEPGPSPKGIRIGSAAFVDAKVRVAAGEVESASDDRALLEALWALETAERRVWVPPKKD